MRPRQMATTASSNQCLTLANRCEKDELEPFAAKSQSIQPAEYAVGNQERPWEQDIMYEVEEKMILADTSDMSGTDTFNMRGTIEHEDGTEKTATGHRVLTANRQVGDSQICRR